MMESLVCHKGNEVVCQKKGAFVKKNLCGNEMGAYTWCTKKYGDRKFFRKVGKGDHKVSEYQEYG